MSTTKHLEGKGVVVTGAGRGIGREIALAVARAGGKVIVNDLDRDVAEEVVTEIKALGGEALANTDSVVSWEGANNMVTQAVDNFGNVGGVVNNAGNLRDVIFHKMTQDDFDQVIGVHLKGSFNVARAAATHFRNQENGAVVNMTSTSGLIGNFGQANYAAAKAGIAALSKSIALDMQRYNVRSNCIAPFAWSRLIATIPTETPDQVARVEKLKKMTADKVAIVAAALLSDQAAHISGQIFAVRMNEIFLMSQSRPLRSVHAGEGWTIDSIFERAMPALQSHFYALDRSQDVFSWDPV
ncbi:MAG: SDR family NAD(P)-dependent oxidoreductase [Gammaproteobacteria bacterium]|nr:SDR family NAD(P)-dependent oxidoreductase [Gammaproteobacteria bacterium]MBK9427976.1 SDR family NAD(P)-dependent oxidoreductase [Gammaproteobacteria bacterium]